MLKETFETFRKSEFKKRKRRSSNSQCLKMFLTLNVRKAFEKLKHCFVNEFLLHYFDLKCKFRVEIDAFMKAIDDVLCQQIENN